MSTRGNPRNLPDHKRCVAKTKASGGKERCPNPRVGGATVCRMHGGGAPQVKAAAQRRMAESKIRQALDEVGIREVDNPLEELRSLTGEVVAWKDALARHVAHLEDQYRYKDRKGGEQLRAEVALYERALDRAAKLLETWARLGIDAMLADMQVRVTGAQVETLTAGLEAYRRAAGVEADAHRAGLEALAGVLRGTRREET